VGVLTVQPGPVTLVNELPGRLEATRVAQVRARVAGIVLKRRFAEGSVVQAGQVLFEIDPAPYTAALASAEATLARAAANAMQADALVERYRPLAAAQAISQQEWTAAQAAQKQAAADIAAARAAVQSARINLGYTRVTAPIAGRTGRAQVTEGALVGQGDATPLVTIQQTDPIYVNFTQSAAEVMKLRRAFDAGQLQPAPGGAARVALVLEDGSVYAKPGRLLFSDLTVDPATGQIGLRAEVPNPKGELPPGLYVRVRIEQALAPNAVLVPQQAVTRSAQGDTAVVLDAQGVPQPRRLRIDGQREGRWIVVDGLAAGDRVVVEGLQKLAMLPPGTPVKAVPWAPQAPGAAAAAASGASAASPAASAAVGKTH
jgi:membrane fusion protein (multidrug efflux system)